MSAEQLTPKTSSESAREAIVFLPLLLPGLLLGALPLLAWRHRLVRLALVAVLGAAAGAVLLLGGALHPGWELLDVVRAAGLHVAYTAGRWGMMPALMTETLFGPTWLLAMAVLHDGQPPKGQRHKRSPTRPLLRSISMDHPTGYIRLGTDMTTGEPVDLRLDATYKGGLINGVSGSGKSVAAERLADGMLASGGSVVALDGKGPGLRPSLENAAKLRSIPLHLLDADDPSSFGVDLLIGGAAAISNKLISGLVPATSGDGSIYRQITQGVAPAIIDALATTNRLTLRQLVKVMADPTQVAALARQAGSEELMEIAALAIGDRLTASALMGLSGRLRALASGHFRPLFEGHSHYFSWSDTDTQSVTYVSLPTLSAPADSSLVARVLLSDLGQHIAARQRSIAAGQDVRPLCVLLDEWLALSVMDGEIERSVTSLLLQARAAKVAMVVAGQTLPENQTTRQIVLGLGFLLALKPTPDDAQSISDSWGTYPTWSTTHQVSDGTFTGAGTSTLSHSFIIHPQELRGDLSSPGAGILSVPPDTPRRVQIAETSEPIQSAVSYWKRRFGLR